MFSLKKKKKKTRDRAAAAGGQANRISAAARSRRNSASVRDIGDCGKPKNPQRRSSTEGNFRLFCEIYFPKIFCLEWSDDHLKAIAKIERAVLQGGLFALAMPRGGGKTVLMTAGAIWALVHGHCRFVCVIGDTAEKACAILESIKAQLAFNDLLADDFPEICVPIRALQGEARRCQGQTSNGKRTRIIWSEDKVVFPEIDGSKAERSIITACGITGSIRGQNHTLPDGSVIRPDLVLPDDPQNHESANSDSQCHDRLSILSSDVLGLAGPGKKIAGLCACTVIRAGDMVDRLLDRKQHPDWQGERCRLMYSLPENVPLWETYAGIRAASLERHGDCRDATEYYRNNRTEMDRGARAAWPTRFDRDEISAIQNAMNLKLRDEAAFYSEYQNEPKSNVSDSVLVRADQIVTKLNGIPRRKLPKGVNTVTAFLDVQDALIYFGIAGFEQDFTGYIADYGAWPDQQRQYFLLREAGPTLQSLTPGNKEGAIHAGLVQVVDWMFANPLLREDGVLIPVDRILIDAGYQTDTVYGYIRAANKGNAVMASRGLGITAGKKPISEYTLGNGEKRGDHWYLANSAGRELRHIRFDANFWKTKLHDRLGLPLGSRGGMSLFGSDPHVHRMVADHIAGSEYAVKTQGYGRELFEFKPLTSKPDNHLLDVFTGCCVGASTIGVGLPPVRKPVSAAARQPVKARQHYL